MTARKLAPSETPTKTTAARKATSVPPDKLRLYQRLIDSVEGVEAKANFGSGYTAINGNMYSMISKYGVVGIRLPEPQRTAFLVKYDTTIFRADPSWPPSKECVAVPDRPQRNTKVLRPYLELRYQYAQVWDRSPSGNDGTFEHRRSPHLTKKLIHWFDIPVDDIERAGKFYSTIFDIELTHLNAPPDFVMKWFPSEEQHGGGGLIQGGGRKPTSDGTVVYFNGGNDLNTFLDRVEPAGGKVILPKTGDEQNGYVAFFLDTEGNRVGLQSMG